MKKPISARVDEETLTYIKGCHEHVNTLINVLLRKWMKDRQDKELLIWKEDTGQDELSQMKAKEDFKCSQCCKNCKYQDKKYILWCIKNQFNSPGQEFCCIYWELKKGSR